MLAIPRTVSTPELAVTEPYCTKSPAVVITDVLVMPFTVNVPALAVIDPSATSDVLAVMVEVLAIPFTVSVPALAVIDPSTTTDVLAVIVDALAIPRMVSTPVLAVIDPAMVRVTEPPTYKSSCSLVSPVTFNPPSSMRAPAALTTSPADATVSPPTALVPPTTSRPPLRMSVFGSDDTTKTRSGSSALASMMASKRLKLYGNGILVFSAMASTLRMLTFMLTTVARFFTSSVDWLLTWS